MAVVKGPGSYWLGVTGLCELLYGEQVLINGLYGDSGAG